MIYQIILISGLLLVSAKLFAIDVSPYQVGQTVNVVQAQELKQRYDNRHKQPWRKPRRSDDIETKKSKQILYGIELLEKTVLTIGPKVADKNMRYSANGLNCSSCHLKGGSGLPGTKHDAIPFVNVMNDYPNFRARNMAIGSAADRVNGCLTRSMGNGKPLANDSAEMAAILAYFSWLAEGGKEDQAMEGTGVPRWKTPARKADLVAGNLVFQKQCIVCHGVDGLGIKASDYNKTGAYQFPPLAGNDSFNNGAGMNRLIRASQFIRANMPLGVDSSQPKLTIDQAYDVAAYIQSLPRPERTNREKDFPNPKFRPKDYAVPAYFGNDKAALEKARLGPFN